MTTRITPLLWLDDQAEEAATIQLASKIPPAAGGRIEVRHVRRFARCRAPAPTVWKPEKKRTHLHPTPKEGIMARYVDGFVVPVPKKKLAAYRRIAQKAGKVWRDHGALEYIECVADDVKRGKWTSFPRSVKLKPGETVVLAYIVYKSRAQRDRVNAQVMKDPRLADMMDPKALPFDGKRMIWGGFKTFVSF